MIKAHIPTEQYGFVEIEYNNRDDLDKNYKRDYVNVKALQYNSTIGWKKAQEKTSPK